MTSWPDPSARAARTALWRHRDFRRYLTGQTASEAARALGYRRSVVTRGGTALGMCTSFEADGTQQVTTTCGTLSSPPPAPCRDNGDAR